ncbi:hypothetical protein E4U21_002215 [Claviceps maximensis]|nr:hypothetical protein E4U21_002215 [Claviceps maximensis]
MAASADCAQLPPAVERQTNFEQAVAYSLHLWPALTLAVQNGWGGPDSIDKRDWFAGATVDLFPAFTDAASSRQTSTTEEPDVEYVETFLLQVMVDEFDVNTDDDSGMEVANNIIRARAQCAIGQFDDEVKKLAERFQKSRGNNVGSMFKQAEDADQDTDWESEDDDQDGDKNSEGDADVDMADAIAPKEKPAPEVDEDGFTKVTSKRR